MTKRIIVCSKIGPRIAREISNWNGGIEPTAVTIGGMTVILQLPQTPEERAALERHEAVHRRQQARDGWWFYPKYWWWDRRRGYWENPYEVEARNAEGANP